MCVCVCVPCLVAQSCLTLCDLMDCSTPGLCPSQSPEVCPSSCSLHRWCHLAISSSDTLFSFCLQSFPASGTFPMSQLFTLDNQNTGVSASASVLPMSIQSWFPLKLTGLISSLSVCVCVCVCKYIYLYIYISSVKLSKEIKLAVCAKQISGRRQGVGRTVYDFKQNFRSFELVLGI